MVTNLMKTNIVDNWNTLPDLSDLSVLDVSYNKLISVMAYSMKQMVQIAPSALIYGVEFNLWCYANAKNHQDNILIY